jgi:hypothetical protein
MLEIVEEKIEKFDSHMGVTPDPNHLDARTCDWLSSKIDIHAPRKSDLKIRYQTIFKSIFGRNKGTPIKSALPYIEMPSQPSLISFGTVPSQSTLRYMR